MTETLRVELNTQERKESGGDVAISFHVSGGDVVVTADWGGMDELYGDGCSIRIPARVWLIALPWIAERLPPPPSVET